MTVDGLLARVFVPTSVRRFGLDVAEDSCTPVTLSKTCQDCAGVCGVHYDIGFGSTLPDAWAARDMARLARSLGLTEGALGHGALQGTCQALTLRFYQSYDGPAT